MFLIHKKTNRWHSPFVGPSRGLLLAVFSAGSKRLAAQVRQARLRQGGMGYFWDKMQQPPGRRSIGGVLKFWGYFFRPLVNVFFSTSTLKWFNSIHHPSKSDMKIPILMIPLAFFQVFWIFRTGNSWAEFQDFSHEGVCALKAFAKVWSKLQQMLNAFNNSWKFEVWEIWIYPRNKWQMKIYTDYLIQGSLNYLFGGGSSNANVW